MKTWTRISLTLAVGLAALFGAAGTAKPTPAVAGAEYKVFFPIIRRSCTTEVTSYSVTPRLAGPGWLEYVIKATTNGCPDGRLELAIGHGDEVGGLVPPIGYQGWHWVHPLFWGGYFDLAEVTQGQTIFKFDFSMRTGYPVTLTLDGQVVYTGTAPLAPVP